MSRDLIEALGAASGIVCVTGAGGKKTTMLRLARAHPGRVALTATTKIPQGFGRDDPELLSFAGKATAADVLGPAAGQRLFAYAGEPSRSGRLRGVEPALVGAVHQAGGFEATYVKADGARMKLAKAHDEGEPRLVPGTTTVLLLASVRAVGRPIDEASIHHPERFAQLAGLAPGDVLTAHGLAAVLAHQTGAIGAMQGAPVVVVLNMADDDPALDTARAVAAALRDRGIAAPVAITAMLAAEPLREMAD